MPHLSQHAPTGDDTSSLRAAILTAPSSPANPNVPSGQKKPTALSFGEQKTPHASSGSRAAILETGFPVGILAIDFILTSCPDVDPADAVGGQPYRA